jgi:hypothetical protein
MAGFIPLIYSMITYVPWILIVPNGINMLVRTFRTDNLGIQMWLPFDATPSPLHEIITLMQVRTYPEVQYRMFTPLTLVGVHVDMRSDNHQNVAKPFKGLVP